MGFTRFIFLVLALFLLNPAHSDTLAPEIRYGVFFGTFDPPHRGHIALMTGALQRLALDRLYVVPNLSPRNKPGATPFERRYELVEMITLRHPGIVLPPRALFERLLKQPPEDPVSAILDALRELEGPTARLYQLCGTDSFNKMVELGKVPTEQENRVVVVVERSGYLGVDTNEISRLRRAGRIVDLSLDLESISSTAVRKAFAEQDESDGLVPDYIEHYVRRNGLYGARPRPPRESGSAVAFRPRNPLVPGAHTSPTFVQHPLGEYVARSILSSPLTLDLDSYLPQKLPLAVLDLVLEHEAEVTVLAALEQDGLQEIARRGGQIENIVAEDRPVISTSFVLGQLDGRKQLWITNIFGRDRLVHTVAQMAQLLAKNLVPLERLTVWQVRGYEGLAQGLCREALSDLTAGPDDTVVLGYRGSLRFIVAELLQYYRERGLAQYRNLTVEDIRSYSDNFRTTYKLEEPPLEGSAHFSYVRYRVPLDGTRVLTLVAFRNLYGEQTELVVDELLARGFTSFISFGSGGGLSEAASIGNVFAPARCRRDGENHELNNLAAKDFPSANGVGVRTLLEEDQDWYQNNRHHDVVDVEHCYLGRALAADKGARLYAGQLVTDRPVHEDYSRLDENAPVMIAAKQRFFLQAILRLVRESTLSQG